jgi:hypothetical protein
LEEPLAAAKNTSPEEFPRFHMTSYLLDVMCIYHTYPQIGWVWKPSDPPIHIYNKVLWEHKYCFEYQKICNNFLIPLYHLIFGYLEPFMIDKA